MPKYLIERSLPGVGRLSPSELASVSQKSNDILNELGSDVQWVHSYVTDNALFCVYNSKDESLIREHARRGGFPCDSVREVSATIDPVTGGM